MIKNEKINLDLRYSDPSSNYGQSIQSNFLSFEIIAKHTEIAKIIGIIRSWNDELPSLITFQNLTEFNRRFENPLLIPVYFFQN